ncbi:Meiosis-specific nuclear structural protein isoform 1 [Schistosoma japonicum]|uniref:Meiosis-specific nuclear structural protein 1 n=1 Tax=Schistosoma japonicum TaxID=6182 RepID=A0A4Z2CQ86_SCHJA|nr:Meiosis-specific nuclear structural protein isoform 1 [Schistosoma japonicum]
MCVILSNLSVTMNKVDSRTDSLSSIDESLAKQLAKIQREQIREQKLRQKIKNESIEIRELEKKLRNAYVAKEQLAQIAEKRALAYDLMTEEALRAHQSASQLGDDLIITEEEELRRKQSQIKLKSELDTQIKEQAELRKKVYEEFLHDKQMVDEVVRRIKQEDEYERQKRQKRKELIRKEIDHYKKEREEHIKAEKENLRRELEAINAYTAKKDDEQQSVKATIKARQERIEKLQDELGKKLLEKEKERQELEELRQIISFEENDKKIREEQKNQWITKFTNQQKLQEDYKKQILLKEEQKQIEREEALKIRNYMLDKFKEDERLEQEELQKRHFKQMEYANEVHQLLIEKRQRIMQEYEQAKKDLDAEKHRILEEKRIVEEERQHLLRQHANNIWDHLPKGIFRSKEEYESLKHLTHEN